MKNIFVMSVIFAFHCSVVHAADPKETESSGICVQCINEQNSKSASQTKKLKEIPAAAQKKYCDYDASLERGGSALKSIVKNGEKEGIKAKEVMMTPSSRTSSSVTYKFPERNLKPGESIYFSIPSDLQDKPVSFVILGHRQDPATEKGTDAKGWDTIPGLTSLQLHDKNMPEQKAWRYWDGMASGEKGAKFAEVRNTLEMENLYGWQTYGSTSVNGGEISKEGIHADGVRVISVGKDDVLIGEVTVKMTPVSPDHKVEKIFTSGSSFNTLVGETAVLAGGQKAQGKFPGAVALGGYSKSENPELPKDWKIINGNTLSIPIPKGKSLTSVEVLGGDSHPDGIKNSDGGWGTQGWSRASIGIETNGKTDWFVENENVPPEGVMTGTPKECQRVTLDGDRVLIRGSADILYIMGVRIGLKDL